MGTREKLINIAGKGVFVTKNKNSVFIEILNSDTGAIVGGHKRIEISVDEYKTKLSTTGRRMMAAAFFAMCENK